jgi:hypothetical protein
MTCLADKWCENACYIKFVAIQEEIEFEMMIYATGYEQHQ